jgi:hypothetical protein
MAAPLKGFGSMTTMSNAGALFRSRFEIAVANGAQAPVGAAVG